MKLVPFKHHRHSIRLKDYDYTQAGAYFVTIVAQDRAGLLGDVIDGEMRLNNAGQMLSAQWNELPQRFSNVELDEFIVMPNHIHGIIAITDTYRATRRVAPTPDVSIGAPLVGAQSDDDKNHDPALGNIVGTWKSVTADEYIRGVRESHWEPFHRKLWQRNYWEHIIRNEKIGNAFARTSPTTRRTGTQTTKTRAAFDEVNSVQRLILSIIVLVYISIAALYAVNTPKWQAPDEPAHFNYIRNIAETGALPILQSGDYNQTYLEQIKAEKFPASMPIDPIRYESYQPPLYYLIAAPIYFVARAGGWDGVIALRLLSVLFGALVLLITYNIVREIFPDDGLLALATVGLMATIPQHIAVSASISNDLAGELIVALILWLALRRAKNVITNRRFVILGGILFGAGLLTKSTTYIPAAALLITAEIARTQITQIRFSFFVLRNLFHVFIVALLIAAPMFVRNMLTYGVMDPLGMARHDAIVIGQPTTAEIIARYGLNHVLFDYLAVTFKSFWAQFGWMGVLVNDRIYVILFALAAAAIFGLALYKLRILRQRDVLTKAQWWGLGLLALVLAIAIIDYVAYNFKFFQLQGRYLFPALVSIAFFLVIGLRELIAREYERGMFVLLYVAFVAFDLASLFLFIVPQLRF